MAQHIAVMLDLETLGLSTDCVIISISAVKFDLGAPHFEILATFNRLINIEGQINRRLEAQTVMWWMNQTKEAQQELLHQPRHGLHNVGKDFFLWYSIEPPKPKTIWSKGVDFDIKIMTEYYRSQSATVPWNYRDQRCYRTLAETLPTAIPQHRVVEHTAKGDAEHQAEHLFMIWKKWNLE